MDGYESGKQTLTVNAQQRVVTVILHRSPPPPSGAFGTLVVRSEADAVVFVDDKQVGITDRQGNFSLPLAPSHDGHSYQVRIEKPQFRTQEQRVEIGTGTSRVLTFKLDPASKGAVEGKISTEDQDWEQVRTATDPGKVQQFLEKHPGSRHEGDATSLLDNLLWRSTSASDATALQAYLKRFPQGSHVADAQAQLLELEWKNTNHNDLAALQSFMTRHSSGPHTDEARGRIDDLQWSKVNQTDARAVRAFTANNPKSAHIAEGRSLLQELDWKDINRNDSKALQAYVDSYPDSPHTNESRRLIEDLAWKQVDKHDRKGVTAFLGSHPNSAHRDEAQGILKQLDLLDADKKGIQDAIDAFNAAFQHQSARELKAIWPGVTPLFGDALDRPGGVTTVMTLAPTAAPVISGDTAVITCDLNSTTTAPGRSTRSPLRERVQLHQKNGRWLIEQISKQ